jgi:hypothetical protein
MCGISVDEEAERGFVARVHAIQYGGVPDERLRQPTPKWAVLFGTGGDVPFRRVARRSPEMCCGHLISAANIESTSGYPKTLGPSRSARAVRLTAIICSA